MSHTLHEQDCDSQATSDAETARAALERGAFVPPASVPSQRDAPVRPDLPLAESENDDDPFAKYATRWLAEHRIDVQVQPRELVRPHADGLHGPCYTVTLRRGERCVSLTYRSSIVDAELQQAPSRLELLMALARESRFTTMKEAVEHEYSKSQAQSLVSFSRDVRRVVPRLALESLQAVQDLYDASLHGHGLVPPTFEQRRMAPVGMELSGARERVLRGSERECGGAHGLAATRERLRETCEALDARLAQLAALLEAVRGEIAQISHQDPMPDDSEQ